MAAKTTAKQDADALLLQALGLNKREVQRLRFDPLVAKAACAAGLAYLKTRSSELKRNHPGFDLDALQALPQLCDRASAAQREAEKASTVRVGTAPELVDAVREWRRKLMPVAEGLAANGKLDAKALDRIRAGKGALDLVRDVEELAALMVPVRGLVEAVCGEGVLEKADAAAKAALSAMGLSPQDTEAARVAGDLRDRYATLVSIGHERLVATVAALSSIKEAQEIVGALWTHRRSRKASEAPVVEDPVVDRPE